MRVRFLRLGFGGAAENAFESGAILKFKDELIKKVLNRVVMIRTKMKSRMGAKETA